jgi:two-component system, OmpR family, response regulator
MRILIIEDEHKIANALKRGLAQESFAVDVAYDGEEGLASAQVEPYDVIVLDRMLPGVDGIAICKALRSGGNHTPIIMLTAKDEVRDRVQGLDAGADDYLIKPFSFEELLARIRALLRRPHEAVPSVLEVDNLQLDPAAYTVMRAGQSIALSGKEFALLEYLMRNAGRIVTKDMIIGHVWDFDADILPNTIEVYIGYLRNKIEKPFADSPKLIYTHRGFGYKLGAE